MNRRKICIFYISPMVSRDALLLTRKKTMTYTKNVYISSPGKRKLYSFITGQYNLQWCGTNFSILELTLYVDLFSPAYSGDITGFTLQ